MAADETYPCHGKLYSTFPAPLWVTQPCTPSNAHTGVRRLGRDEHLAAPVGLFAGVIQCAVTALFWASKEKKYFSEIAVDPRDEIEKLIIVSSYERHMMVPWQPPLRENRTFIPGTPGDTFL